MYSIKSYVNTLDEIKKRIRDAQVKAILSVNSQMINMYWDIGEIIYKKQKEEGWGAKIIFKLSKDIHNDIPEIKGFSERNIKFMVQLYKEYAIKHPIGKQPVSQLEKMKQKKIKFLNKCRLQNKEVENEHCIFTRIIKKNEESDSR